MIGVGLRHQHFSEILKKLEGNPSSFKSQWFEGITENFFETEGRPIKILEQIRKDFPIGLHGVSLSIASDEELDFDYLKKVKNLYQRIDPFLVSDHLCWTGHKNRNLHNLLPFPYTDSTLDYLVSKIQTVQEFLGRNLAIENLSAYFTLNSSTYHESEFLNLLARKSGCKILLDLNNIYVNSVNQHFDPQMYLNNIEPHYIAEMHLAGFSDMGTHLFDTHSCPVWPQVWELFKTQNKLIPNVPVLIEWDEDIPSFDQLEQEVQKAQEHRGVSDA